MKLKTLVVVFSFFLASVAVTHFGFEAISQAGSDGKIIVDKHKQSRVTVPDGWKEVPNLNAEAEIKARSDAENSYLIGYNDDTSNFPSFQGYSKIASSGVVSRLESGKISGPTILIVSGVNVLQYKISGTVKGLKVIYL